MVAILLGWKFCSSLFRDEVAELGSLTFELSRLVFRIDLACGQSPVADKSRPNGSIHSPN